jgi:hypothetical protein
MLTYLLWCWYCRQHQCAEDVINSMKVAAPVSTFHGVDLDANIRTPRAAWDDGIH